MGADPRYNALMETTATNNRGDKSTMSKTTNHDDFNDRPTVVAARKLFESLRGHLLISQALCIAIEELEKVEPPVMRESSNIADMKFLRDELFHLHANIHGMSKTAAARDSTD